MLNVVRRSQMIGLRAVDRTTATNFNTIEEVWVDDTGRAAYLAGTQGYTPLEQVEVIEPDAPFGERAVLFPEDVAAINSEVIILQDGASERLKSEKHFMRIDYPDNNFFTIISGHNRNSKVNGSSFH